jgi:hypothetical protein
MKKTFLFTLTVLAGLLFFQSATVEAREHRHRGCHGHGPRVQVTVGNTYGQDVYVVRRYVQPVAPIVYVPATPYAAPVAVPVAYAIPASPAYVEDVYVAPRRPISFAGLFLSLLFR